MLCCLQRTRALATQSIQVSASISQKLSLSELSKGTHGRHARLVGSLPSLAQLPAMLQKQFASQATNNAWEVFELDDQVGSAGQKHCSSCHGRYMIQADDIAWPLVAHCVNWMIASTCVPACNEKAEYERDPMTVEFNDTGGKGRSKLAKSLSSHACR